MGFSLPELTAFVTAFGAILAGLFGFFSYQNKSAVEGYKSQIDGLEQQIKDMRLDMAEMKATVLAQSIKISDQAKHIRKLEIRMTVAGIEIPPFESSADV